MGDGVWYVTHPLTGDLLYTADTEQEARDWAAVNARTMIVRVSRTK